MRPILTITLLLSLTVSGFANSYAIHPIELPKEQDVVAFTNGLPPSVGPHNKKSKEEITKFLRLGKYTSKELTDSQLLKLDSGNKIQGVFTDKQGVFYFWTLITDDLLLLQTADCGGAVLGLEKENSR